MNEMVVNNLRLTRILNYRELLRVFVRCLHLVQHADSGGTKKTLVL